MAVFSISKPKWLTADVPEQMTVIPKETFLKERVESGGRQPVPAVLNADEEVVPAPVVDALGGSKGVTAALNNDLPAGKTLTGDAGRVGNGGYNVQGIACGTVGKIKNMACGTVGGLKSKVKNYAGGTVSRTTLGRASDDLTGGSAVAPTTSTVSRTTLGRASDNLVGGYAAAPTPAPVTLSTTPLSAVTETISGTTPTATKTTTAVGVRPADPVQKAINAYTASNGNVLPDTTGWNTEQLKQFNIAKNKLSAASGIKPTAEQIAAASGGNVANPNDPVQKAIKMFTDSNGNVLPDTTGWTADQLNIAKNRLAAKSGVAADPVTTAINAYTASNGQTTPDTTGWNADQLKQLNIAKNRLAAKSGVKPTQEQIVAASGGNVLPAATAAAAPVGIADGYRGASRAPTGAENPADQAARMRLQADLQQRSTAAQQASAQDLAQRGIKGSAAASILSEQQAQAESERAKAGAELASTQAQTAAASAEAEKGRQFTTSERLSTQDWSSKEAELGRSFTTAEREAIEKYNTGERLSTQEWQTLERIGGQQFVSSERTQTQDWQAFQAQLGREFTTDEREAIQKYQTGERLSEQEWQTLERISGQTYNTSEREASQKFSTATDALNVALQTKDYAGFNAALQAIDPTIPPVDFSRLDNEQTISQLVDLANSYPDAAEIFMTPALEMWSGMSGVDINPAALQKALDDAESGNWESPEAKALVGTLITTGTLTFLDSPEGAIYTQQIEANPEGKAILDAVDAGTVTEDQLEQLGLMAQTAFMLSGKQGPSWSDEFVRDAINMGFKIPEDSGYTAPENKPKEMDWSAYLQPDTKEYDRLKAKAPTIAKDTKAYHIVKVPYGQPGAGGRTNAFNDYYNIPALDAAAKNNQLVNYNGTLYTVVEHIPDKDLGRALYTLTDPVTGTTLDNFPLLTNRVIHGTTIPS